MVSRRRRHGSARATGLWLAAMAAFSVLALAEELVSHIVVFVPAAAVTLSGAYLAGRHHGKQLGFRVQSGSTGQGAGLKTENASLRRQVAKLEADAARTDQLLGDLEHAARRPIETVLASYQAIQGQYRWRP